MFSNIPNLSTFTFTERGYQTCCSVEDFALSFTHTPFRFLTDWQLFPTQSVVHFVDFNLKTKVSKEKHSHEKKISLSISNTDTPQRTIQTPQFHQEIHMQFHSNNLIENSLPQCDKEVFHWMGSTHNMNLFEEREREKEWILKLIVFCFDWKECHLHNSPHYWLCIHLQWDMNHDCFDNIDNRKSYNTQYILEWSKWRLLKWKLPLIITHKNKQTSWQKSPKQFPGGHSLCINV